MINTKKIHKSQYNDNKSIVIHGLYRNTDGAYIDISGYRSRIVGLLESLPQRVTTALLR